MDGGRHRSPRGAAVASHDNETALNNLEAAQGAKQRAVLRAQAGEFDAAIALFRRHLEVDPSDAEVLCTVGDLMATQGDSTGARCFLERAVRIAPASPSVHESLANLHLAAGRHGLAVAGYRKAVEIDPSLASAHSSLGAILFRLGQVGDAQAHLEKALELDEGDATAHNSLGNVLMSAGETAQAARHYEAAANIKPDWARSHHDLGRALSRLGRRQEAIEAYRQALRLEPGSLKITVALADELVANGLMGEAVRMLEAFHVFLGPETERTIAIAELYGDTVCSKFVLTDYAPEMARSIALFRPELTVDAGISRAKIAPQLDRTVSSVGSPDCHFTYCTSTEAQESDLVDYYKRKRDLAGVNPIARRFDLPIELEKLIDLRGRPLAIVCHEDARGETRTTGITPAETFVPALECLRDRGFQIVHTGRGPIPACYKHLEVVDYSGSGQVTFKNDLALYSNADFCLFGHTGPTAFAEVMGTPFVLANVLDLSHPPPSHFCVYTVARTRDKTTGSPVTFNVQADLHASGRTEVLPKQRDVLCGDGADILAATQEALAMRDSPPRLSEKQRRYANLISRFPCADLASSRISAAFVERYSGLF